jgi:SET domain-containing protein
MIQLPTKIYIDNSPVHGLGVFAKEKINEGELIEECTILTLPIQKGEDSNLFIDYRFNFPSGPEWQEQVLAMGYGVIYNHSNTPNAYWYSNNEKRTFLFVALRDIEVGEEIFTYYGDESYWSEGRTYFDLK